ncbi:MAG TPA: aminoacyl-tRNA hydrolase [Candidatus Omnitrophota bacterium]|nr:aminoacyl-tRNA hydrolase [Candidatus Omnitrophota bacterium]HPS20664.1 aminoacyl-tRNA hydrolase [Candidatus Omnitrophota bacterium]
MKIIIGLGNPGLQYRNTRHNVGFMVVEEFAVKYGYKIKNNGFQGLYGIGKVADHEIMLFEPQTFMNLSGEAVKAVFNAKAEGLEDMLVISDDFALPIGTIRMRENGSAGGHNGLKSIIEHIGPEFARLRIGIGSEKMPQDRSVFVLAPFLREESELLEKVFDEAVDCIEVWINEGVKKAISKCKCA